MFILFAKHLIRGYKCLVLASVATLSMAQVDPGVRGGPAGAGGPIPGLTAGESDFFTNVGNPLSTRLKASRKALDRASIWIPAAVATSIPRWVDRARPIIILR